MPYQVRMKCMKIILAIKKNAFAPKTKNLLTVKDRQEGMSLEEALKILNVSKNTSREEMIHV